MTTAQELIDYLQTLPGETIVSVIEGYERILQYDVQSEPREVDLDLSKHVEFTDFEGNPYVKKEYEYYNKKYLTLWVL